MLKHYKGVCHLYVDEAADLMMADAIAENGKVSRPSVCNAVETILVHEAVAEQFLPMLKTTFDAAGVTIHGCEASQRILGDKVAPATDADWEAEYLSLDVALRVVPSIDEAIAHIARWGSDHTEAIITGSINAANHFRSNVQSGCVMINASTRFADGFEYGLGAEIGISTDKIHARGPVGLDGLTSEKYVVLGSGQVRN